MPEIAKMSANPKPVDPKLITNPLDRITAVKQVQREGLKFSIYGRPKTGKTRVAASFPKPVMFIATEDGTESIGPADDVDMCLIQKTDEIRILVDHACKGGLSKQSRKPYQSIALDNATQMQSMLLAEMLGLDHIPIQHARGAVQNVDNQEYSMRTKELLAYLLKFKGNVIFLAHEKNHTEDGTQSDLIIPTIGSSVSKAVANWLNGVCSYVCQTFIREEKVQQDVGGGVMMETGTGKGQYCLRIGAHPIYMTGFRVPPGRDKYVPDAIVNPTYDKIMEVINGTKTAPK